MSVCKFCGADVPNKELFRHFHAEHPDEMQKIRHTPKRKDKAPEKPSLSTQATPVIPETAPKKEPPQKEQPGGNGEHPSGKGETTEKIKGRFITKVIDLPGDILVLYWLAKAAFPGYDADEGEWIGDCIRQFYAEHAEELNLNKLFDKTYQVVPAGVTDAKG